MNTDILAVDRKRMPGFSKSLKKTVRQGRKDRGVIVGLPSASKRAKVDS